MLWCINSGTPRLGGGGRGGGWRAHLQDGRPALGTFPGAANSAEVSPNTQNVLQAQTGPKERGVTQEGHQE